MTSILVIIAFIIVVALLFWLDRKDKEDNEEAKKIYEEIFDILNKINWNISPNHLRKTFPGKEFLNLKDKDELSSLSYKDKIDGQDIIVSFYFAEEGDVKLVGSDLLFPHISKNEVDFIFGKVLEKYGEPLDQDQRPDKTLLWNTQKGIMTLEASKGETILIGLWNKEFYNEIE